MTEGQTTFGLPMLQLTTLGPPVYNVVLECPLLGVMCLSTNWQSNDRYVIGQMSCYEKLPKGIVTKSKILNTEKY